MAVAGRKPKDGPKRNRVAAVHEWTTVADERYEGPRPELPESRRVEWTDRELGRCSEMQPLQQLTRVWWERITGMPHCVLWDDGDWQFAITTAMVADAVFAGDVRLAGELRQRERVIGTTLDARRDLRIRYVPVEDADQDDEQPLAAAVDARPVTRLADRRRRLIADAP
ncbi:hypothetical protein O1L68_27615 [Streptomyces lydicus]|nr:hypothetical protein [Streptomyces lydicus]